MPEFRRSHVQGGTYFFTVVTYNRKPILTDPRARDLLRSAWIDVRRRFPFQTDAICLLPDHIHCVWTLPEGDSQYSLRWKEIKRLFSRAYTQLIGSGEYRNESRLKREEVAIWQRRFWEHTIHDPNDLHHHLDYLHYNPVKHGLVTNVSEWAWSSFHRFVRQGYYDKDWGCSGKPELDSINFGE